MTQEEKYLLLKDLCARIPYEVKVQVFNYGTESVETLYQIDLDGYISTIEGDELKYSYKPYLFPLSSMTEEQKKESPFESSLLNAFINGYISLFEDEELTVDDIVRMLNWLNKNYFDYRGLIEKGLAIDATGLNIYYL